MQGNVIFDNVKIRYYTGSDIATGKHGDESNYGIFADGYHLIIGTKVEVLGGSDANSYIQITGGSRSGSTGSTDVVVFSGTYSNIVAGSNNQRLEGSTNLVIRGDTTVLDTVVGGNSGDKDGATEGNVITGSTNVYMLGGCLPADSYQEGKIGTTGTTEGETPTESMIPADVTLIESTILTGGSNNGKVEGDTNVFISGDATLWDVQGGGRRGQSTIDGTVYVEVSGLAVIRHVLCGSITDGLDGKPGNGSPNDISSYKGSVHKVQMTVKHGAMVASVFGAGYDTYYKPLYSSMFGSNASIDIDIVGGTVGYVYGGGYRGAVGYTGDLSDNPGRSPIDSISIEVSGSAKVLGDVYGGGRGGVDKVTHNGGNPGYDVNGGFEDSTGFAWTCAKSISIIISGNATIDGSVYGGGESVAVLEGKKSRSDVAKVMAETIVIDVRDQATIDGAIYGSGRGVDINNETVLTTSGTVTFKPETGADVWTGRFISETTEIPWYDKVPEGLKDISYANYAKVGDESTRVSITITTGSDTTIGNVTGNSSVFGAGGRAETYASSISLNLDGTLNGSVYGAGESASTNISGPIGIVIGGGSQTTVNGDVFGAGMNGRTDSGSITISIGNSEYMSTIAGTVFGAGDGSSATTDLSGSIGITIINSVVGNGTNAVFGAGNSASTNASNGSINVSIDGSKIEGNVFGTASTAKTEVDSVSVFIGRDSMTTVDGTVFGAGFGSAAVSYANSIYIDLGQATVGKNGSGVYGTGMEAPTYVDGSVSVTIGYHGLSTTVNGNVYGTGKSATTDVSGSIGIVIGGGSQTTVNGDVFGAGMNGETDANSIFISIGNNDRRSTVNGNVFGAGDGSTAMTNLGGSIVITILNSTIGGGTNAVFGAGNSAPTSASNGSINVSIDGSKIEGNVFGTASTAKTEVDSVSVFIGRDSMTTVDGTVFGAGFGSAAVSYANSIYIDLGQATVGKNGSGVYGTGMEAPTYVDGSVSVTIGYHGLATTVNGSVFGGGQNANTEDRNTGNPQTSLTVGLSINGGTSEGSMINGDVYGAGEYGMVKADRISVNLGDGTGVAPVITGDVYGGGLGNMDQYSVESDRFVVLNNAIVNGSIYAGTRNGNDGITSDVPSTVTTTAEIDLIAGTVRQNVYGGGFQGTSVYNVTIRFGTPAVDNVHPANIPYPTDLRVTSIYGGAYYDPASGSQAEDLVLGSATILIGSSGLSGGYVFGGYTNVGDAGSGARISISGNVFGDGSYSTVKGETVVEFDGYTQTSDVQSQRMMSVQLVDVLRFITSHVEFSGSSQGGTGQLSERMSLYDIGSLNLHASSSLGLYAGTSEIGALNSYNDESGNDLSHIEDFSGTGGNMIALLGGVPVTILGKDDDGIASETDDSLGVISGFTELDNGGDVYYGAFVLGSSKTDDNNGGFVVSNDSGGYDIASVLEYNKHIKIWFIAGATSMDKMMTFSANQGGGYAGSNDSENVTIPKISEDSKLYYTGAYIDYESQNSMYVVDGEDTSTGTGKVVFDMTLTSVGTSNVSVATHTYKEGNWVLSTSSSNLEIGRQVSIKSSLRAGWMEPDQTGHSQPASYGLLGYVVVQVIEAYDYGTVAGGVQVPIHTIDIIVGMYVEPEDGKGQFNVTLVEDDKGLYTGTVYIPLSWKGVVTDYRLSDFEVSGFAIGKNVFTLSAGTLMGMDGWSQTDYRDGYDIDNRAVDFGSGGVAQPVLVLDYSGPGLSGNTGTLTFGVTLTPDSGVNVVGVTKYTITVIFSNAEPVHVYLQYTELNNGIRYVLSSSDDGMTLSWQKADNDTVGYGFELPFNTAITDYVFAEDVTVGGKSYSDLTSVLDALINSITSSDIKGFVYSEHFAGWFSDPEMIRLYNMGSNVSQDIVIYAKFGVKVTFDYGNNTAPYQTFIGYNTSLNDNGIFNYGQIGENVTSDMVPGYDYFSGSRTYTGHYLLTENWIGDPSYKDLTSFDFRQELMKDVTLYIAWGVEAYKVEVVVDFEGDAQDTGNWFNLTGGSDRTSWDDIWQSSGNGGSISFLADYNGTVSLTISDGMHIGRGTTGYYGSNQVLTFIGDSSSTQSISFRVPDAGEDYSKNNNAQIQIRITVTDLFDVTVELIYVDEFTSQLQDGDSLYATASNGSDVRINGGAPHTGTVTLYNLPVNTTITLGTTVHEGSGYTYSTSVWVNGTLMEGEYELKVSGKNIDPVVTVALHRTVDILNQIDWDEAHISGITVYDVAVPDTLDGEWGYEYRSVWISAEEIQNLGETYQVWENDAFVITPLNGYMIYDEPEKEPYCPANTVRVVDGDVLYFSVSGNGDISFKALTKIEQALNILFEFIDSDGQQYIGSVGAIGDWSIQLVFNGMTYSITVNEASNQTHLVVPYPVGQTVEYTASLEGFSDTSDRFSGGGDTITVQMRLIEFTVLFHDLNNNVTDVSWTVFNGTEVPAPSGFETADDPDEPGHGLYVHVDQGGTPLSFISNITTEMFDASHTMHISAIAQPDGWVGGEVTEGVTAVITASDLKDGHADIGSGLFGGNDVTFTFDGKDITYDAGTGVLEFNDARIPASGSVTIVSGGHMLTIYVIADAEAIL